MASSIIPVPPSGGEKLFYTVIFVKSRHGFITENRITATVIKQVLADVFIQQFPTRCAAEKCIDDLHFKRAEKSIPSCRLVDTAHLALIKDLINRMSQMIGSLQEVLSTQTNLPDSATRKISSWSDNFFGEIIKMTCMYFMDNGKVFDTPVEIRLPNRRYKCIGPHEPFNSTTLILESARNALLINENNEVVVFISSINNGQRIAGIGIWFGKSHSLNMTIKICGVKDTFKADMVSIIKAIDCVKTMGLSKINIHTNSKTAKKSVYETVPNLKNNDWKTEDGSVFDDISMCELLFNSIASMETVKLTYVPDSTRRIGILIAEKFAKLVAG